MTTGALYDDGHTMLDEVGMTLRSYHFPFATAKRIPYSAIVSFERRPMSWLTGRLRLWGSTGLRVWMPFDPSRLSKSEAIVVDIGGRIRPACSPDDVDAVMAILAERV